LDKPSPGIISYPAGDFYKFSSGNDRLQAGDINQSGINEIVIRERNVLLMREPF
jgi:hypothetical protein